MSFQRAPRGERLTDLRAQIEAQVQMKRYYLSFKSPEQRERQLAEAQRLRDNAAKIVEQAERIESACRDWKAGYIAADDRVLELRQMMLETENEKRIDRLDDLADRMAELIAETAEVTGGGE